jgi:hypothetical protein
MFGLVLQAAQRHKAMERINVLLMILGFKVNAAKLLNYLTVQEKCGEKSLFLGNLLLLRMKITRISYE